MQTILKRQTTLYIILISLAMLSTSNALPTQSNNNPTNNTPIKNNFDTKEYGNCRSNYTSTTLRWNDKEYIINPADIDDIKKKKESIINGNKSFYYILEAVGISGGAIIISPLIESIFGIRQPYAKLTGMTIGAIASACFIQLILYEYELKPMHTYLEQEQKAYLNTKK